MCFLNSAGPAIVWDLLFHPEVYAERQEKSSRRRGECCDRPTHWLWYTQTILSARCVGNTGSDTIRNEMRILLNGGFWPGLFCAACILPQEAMPQIMICLGSPVASNGTTPDSRRTTDGSEVEASESMCFPSKMRPGAVQRRWRRSAPLRRSLAPLRRSAPFGAVRLTNVSRRLSTLAAVACNGSVRAMLQYDGVATVDIECGG